MRANRNVVRRHSAVPWATIRVDEDTFNRWLAVPKTEREGTITTTFVGFVLVTSRETPVLETINTSWNINLI